MQFTRVVTFLFFTLTLGLFAFASPVATHENSIATLSKRYDNADIVSVLQELKSQTGVILPKLDELVATEKTSDETVAPLIGELTTALNTAAVSLAKLPISELRKRQSDDEVANLVAGIIADITNTLNGLLDAADTIPLLGGLLAGVDTSLNQVLLGLEILLAGVLRLVANLLTGVANLLRSLALGLTLGTLGL